MLVNFNKDKHQIGYIRKNLRGNRIYSTLFKSITITANSGGIGTNTGLYYINNKIRKLSPNECEDLQTVPKDYTYGVSPTQRYKMLGNGWTVDVIKYILSNIEE